MSLENRQIATQLVKSGAEFDEAVFARQVAKDARVRRQRVHAATRNAADFHCKVEDLIDTEEITEDMKQMPRLQLGSKDKEGMRHRIATAKVGRKLHQCIRCNKRQIFLKFLCERIQLMCGRTWVGTICKEL